MLKLTGWLASLVSSVCLASSADWLAAWLAWFGWFSPFGWLTGLA